MTSQPAQRQQLSAAKLDTSDPSQLLSKLPRTADLSLKRRHFLQSVGAVGAAAMLPAAFAEQAAAATPLGTKEGVLVLITLEGGCDGLDMVVPIGNSEYYAKRGGIAIPAATTHSLDASRGLHPALTTVKERWDRGQVAVIEGVGNPAGNLSHFDNMARLMAAQANETNRTTGWLGRYIDGLPGNDSAFHGISFGSSIPLDSRGQHRSSVALRTQHNRLPDPATASAEERNQMLALRTFGTNQLQRGSVATMVAQASREAVDMAAAVGPLYQPELPEGDLHSQMVMAARLINADIGVRVLSLKFGNFDGHADHRGHMDEGMQELNDGIEAFLNVLDYEFLDRAMILTTTEFGRRVIPNNSGGTDHGAASTYLAIGTQVKGGFYGSSPSLTDLDRRHNLRINVDYRAVYGTVLDRWLDGDSQEVLGANFEDLNFTHAPATIDPGPHPAFAAGLERRDQVIRLYLAYFLRMPDASGLDYWISQRMQGASIDAVSNAFAASPEFRQAYGSLSNRDFAGLVYRNVLERQGDREGLTYWSSELDRGVSRGQVMTGFSDSSEYRTKTSSDIDDFDQTGPIARLYRAYFRRAPERGGRDYWNSAGKSLGDVSQAFSESAEFAQIYGELNNADFVNLVYDNVLGRTAEGAGAQFWTSELNGGMARGALMIHFSEAEEFAAQFK